uniref:Amino acid permease/ SLC12A domain-containing protein n=1 Tax=Hemiselmis andersenii TaxID=464988 RepID=A0A6U4JRF5_HEMAN
MAETPLMRDGSEEGGRGVKTKAAHRVRTLGKLSLIGIMYFSVAGGPEGTETLVKTGGPLATFIGIIVLGVVFAVPLALMTAELSTMYPENGGFVLWAKAAFGDTAGGMAGWLQFCCSAVDTALYPGLFLTYVSQTMHADFAEEIKWAIKGGFIVMITVLNLAGIDSVGHGSSAMMFFLLAPFGVIALICATGAFTGTTVTGWPFETANLAESIPNPDWGQFVLVLIWNMGMWETASVCSGEVDDVSVQFPPALAITVVLVVLNYILPIASFVGLNGDASKYDNGFYITIIDTVGGPFWSTWLGVSQCVSASGLFTNGIVKNAWMLCGMGEQGMLPTVFASRLKWTGAPGVAIAITQLVTVGMVLYGDFEAVLAVDMLLYTASLLLEIASTIYLRHTEPDLERPYRIPCDGALLCLFFMPSVAIVFFGYAMAEFHDLLVTAIFIILGLILVEMLRRCKQHRPAWFAGDETVEHVEHHDPFAHQRKPEDEDGMYQSEDGFDRDTRMLLPNESTIRGIA